MSRRPASPLSLPVCAMLALSALLALGPRSASADERVPMIGNDQLPVLGTLAPIARENVTHVRVGQRDDIRWFAVLGVEGVLDYPALVKVLKARAGTQRPSPHGVWLTATAQHAWAHALVVVKACYEAGIYRVGVRARSEATGRALGFPLFIPPGKTGVQGPKAGELDVRVDALHPREVKGASDVGHVYAAVRRALERRDEFGVEKIIAKIWLSPNTPLQYALKAIDLLYRGGCAGVRVQMSMRSSWRGLDVVPVIEIQGGVASRNPQSMKPPVIQPRARPWTVNGANEPGWVDFEVVELPAIDTSDRPAAPRGPQIRPNYAAEPNGVPEGIAKRVDQIIRGWARGLGEDMNEMIRQPMGISPKVQKRFSVALRRKEALPEVVMPARKAFPDAMGVFPSTLRFHAYLFQDGRIQGRADLTLCLTGPEVQVVTGSFEPLDASASITLVPFGVDPFAAGEASAFRVWIENLLHGLAHTRGARLSVPLAPIPEVLRYLPASAHTETAKALAPRDAGLLALQQTLGTLRYDRVALVPQTGSAAVTGANRRVVGTLTMRFEAQESELRVNGLTARRAP